MINFVLLSHKLPEEPYVKPTYQRYSNASQMNRTLKLCP